MRAKETMGDSTDSPTAWESQVTPATPTPDQVSHTPGPWDWFVGRYAEPVYRGDGVTPCIKHLIGADGQGFAVTVGLSEPRDLAKARLMASAPDLLAALRSLCGVSRSVTKDTVEIPRDEWHALMQQVYAATDRAEGKS